MVLYIPTDISSHPVEEAVTLHCMTFEGGVAFGKFFHQFLESCALKTNFCFGILLLDATVVFIPDSRIRLLDLAGIDLVR